MPLSSLFLIIFTFINIGMIENPNIQNPFRISKMSIDGLNIETDFQLLRFEEDLFHQFLYGSVLVSRVAFDNYPEWDNPELGALDRVLTLQYTTDLNNEEENSEITLEFIVYAIKRSEENLNLSLIQSTAVDFYTKEFQDGWEDVNVNVILSDIINKHSGSTLTVDSPSLTKTSFTNPNWTPVQAVQYLLPEYQNDNGLLGSVMYSNVDGDLTLDSINRLLKTKPNGSEEVLVRQGSHEAVKNPKHMSANLSELSSYEFSRGSQNIITQIQDGIISSTNLEEYNIINKASKSTIINSVIENDLERIGSNSGLIDSYESIISSRFALANGNQAVKIKNDIIIDYVSRNYISVGIPAISSRRVATWVKLDLSTDDKFLVDPMTEFSDYVLVTKISHVFSQSNYQQTLNLFQSGLNDYTERRKQTQEK